jgi:hypothetical protein
MNIWGVEVSEYKCCYCGCASFRKLRGWAILECCECMTQFTLEAMKYVIMGGKSE